MITKGTELTTFVTGLNGNATIDPDLLATLIITAQTIIEEDRPWMVLRNTDTSKTVTTGNTWQTAIDLSAIPNFSQFYSDVPIRLFDGNNRIEYYSLKPFDRRLEYKDVSNTAVYDEANKILYLNGTVPFNGTLYLNTVLSDTPIDPTSASAVWIKFPARFLPLVAYYAVGFYKGGIDYDSISRLMLPSHQQIFGALKDSMEKWDDKKQMAALETNDPTDLYSYPRSGAIDRSDS